MKSPLCVCVCVGLSVYTCILPLKLFDACTDVQETSTVDYTA
jgi:hypothetical protein